MAFIPVKTRLSNLELYWLIFFSRLLLLFAVVFTIGTVMERVVIVRGKSVPHTVLFSSPGAVARMGDYVTVTVYPDTHAVIDKRSVFLKRVACDSGQFIELVNDTFFCDDHRLGGFVRETLDGRPLQPWPGGVVIPDGKAFIMGSHPRSFDSRYFGLVRKEDLIVARVIF